MRLTPAPRPEPAALAPIADDPASPRPTSARGRLGGALVALLLAALAPRPAAAAPPPPPDPEDILGDLVVEAKRKEVKPLRLPKIGVEALGDDEATQKLLAILRRDLDLSFELEVLGEAAPAPPPAPAAPSDPEAEGAAGGAPSTGPSSASASSSATSAAASTTSAAASAPAAATASPTPTGAGLDRWRRAGAEYVVQVAATLKDEEAADLSVILYSLRDGDGPVFKRTLSAAKGQRRLTSHRLSDAILGAITGYTGPFASQLVYARNDKGARRVEVIDADGHGRKARSPIEHLAVSPTFGPGGALYYAASVDRGRYKLYREGDPNPLAVPIVGSIYGLAVNDDRSQIALSIAVDGDVRVFVGPADLSSLEPKSTLPLALHPVFSPRGQLAFAGTARVLQRIYVDGRAISAKGLSAAAPTFCRHPEGTRVVYSVAVGKREDLIATDERGGDTVRLTSGKGRNNFPACSPDGRLVAFFSDRSGGEGPGLYLMRVDGRRPPKKVADVIGDTLRWARTP